MNNQCIKYYTPHFKDTMNTTTTATASATATATANNAASNASGGAPETVFQLPEKTSFTLENGIKIKFGKDTDIGGSSINQDACCAFKFKSETLNKSGFAICVADGHGDKGEISSSIGITSLQKLIRDNVDELFTEPIQFLNRAFIHIHDQIKIGLIEQLTKEKFEVEVKIETGEILKRRMPSHAFTSLKSGTTFSVIVLLDNKLYIANVGDSTGILYSEKPVLKPSHLKHELNASVLPNTDSLDEPSTYIELTGDHSPENPQEYIRMRKVKCSEENPLFAELMCVYNEEKPKHMCPHVFDISAEGVPTVRPEDGSFGFHYKTVRKEKATYVTDKYGNDALSVTRALGDYALSYRGVSCEPEIRSVDLETIFSQMNPEEATVAVVLCSDGVWDNWIYDHVGKFMFDKSCLNALATDTERGAERITKSFMLRNQAFAKKNFGWNSDNATGIVMYIEKR